MSKMIDGDALIMSLTDWWYSSFGLEETEESKAVKRVIGEVQEYIKGYPTYREWIPVSERLPEKDGTYLCDYNGKIHTCMMINRHFRHYGEIADHLITAWQPLPDPYRGGVN